jgi:hypothetical protein
MRLKLETRPLAGLTLALALLISACAIERLRASDFVGVWKFDSFFAPLGTSPPKSLEASTLSLRADGTCDGDLPPILIHGRSDGGDRYAPIRINGNWHLKFSESNDCLMIDIWCRLPEGHFGFGFAVKSQSEIVTYVGDPDDNNRFILRKEK